MLNKTANLLNFTATVHLFYVFTDPISHSLSFFCTLKAFLSSQLSLMYIALSNKRHKINPLLSICVLQNHPASNQYTFRLDDRGKRCVCVCGCYAIKRASYSANKSVSVCVPVCVQSCLGLFNKKCTVTL